MERRTDTPRTNTWKEVHQTVSCGYPRVRRLGGIIGYHSSILGLPCGSAGKESTCSAGDLGLIPELRRSPGEGNSCPLQHSGLESSMGGIVPGVAKSQTRPSHFHFHSLQFPVLFASFFFWQWMYVLLIRTILDTFSGRESDSPKIVPFMFCSFRAHALIVVGYNGSCQVLVKMYQTYILSLIN